MNGLRIACAACLALTLAACDDGGGSDAGTDAGITLDCDSYCTAIANTCTGDATQYPDRDTCLATCALIPLGTAEDTGGNTVGCRLYHVGQAADLGLEHCDHAGPAGAHECGSTCESYCNFVTASCTGGDAQYASADECMTACAAFPGAEYSASVTSGDKIACRLHYATLAAAGDTASCANAGTSSTACAD